MGLRPDYNEPTREDVSERFMIAQDGPRPSTEQLELQHDLRQDFAELAQKINVIIEDSREKSLAITKIEEALMWAGKAIFK